MIEFIFGILLGIFLAQFDWVKRLVLKLRRKVAAKELPHDQ